MDAILAYKPKEEDDLYSLLGCDELSSTEQIIAEYKIRAKVLHPDKNTENAEANKKFVVIQRAKEILCDPSLRAKYDQWRRAGIAVPFDDWMAKQDLVHMSMHWASQKPKKHMLEGTDYVDKEKTEPETKEKSNASVRDLFRSYQI